MYSKKKIKQDSPDLSKMQPVVIDHRTVIYISMDEDADEAREKYQERATHFLKKK